VGATFSFLIIATVLALSSPAKAIGQDRFDASRYTPKSLATLIRELPRTATGIAVSPDIPIRAEVVYTGEFRPLAADSARLLDAWGGSMGVTGLRDVFRQEVMVREGTVEYWLPVQDTLMPVLQRELTAGATIEVLAIYIGQVDDRALFLINAFRDDHPHGTRSTITDDWSENG
jgi:hypothetical protein